MDLLKDLWGFLKTRKEILATPNYSDLATVRCLDRNDQWHSNRTVYLHTFLKTDYD